MSSTATRRPRRLRASPLALGLGGLGAAALLVLALIAAGQSGPDSVAASGGAGPLVWKASPRVYRSRGMPRDRIITGVVRNDSLRIAEVDAGDVQVVDGGGDRLASAGIFVGSFVRGLWSGSRRDQASDIERRRIGRLLRLGPGGERPLTVSWRTGPRGEPAARIDYRTGSLPVP